MEMNRVRLILYIVFCLPLSFIACAQQNLKTDSIADKMLVYQLSNGAWPKQLIGGWVVNYSAPLDEALLQKIKATTYMHATIDNSATSREIRTLVKAYKNTQQKKYLEAAERGIDYLFTAQYKNGGWPQYYPDNSSYRAEITYNDNAMINVMNIMLDIATKTNDFEQVNTKYILKAQDAVKRGIDCIIKTQIVQQGKLSIWAAQYDQNSLKAAKARNFEPASLSSAESVGIVKFLMRLKNPDEATKRAINQAIIWFEAAKIEGYRFDKLPDVKDKGLIKDDKAVIWARFYDFDTNKPIFGDRDNSIKSNVAEISYERRNGYAWYGNWPLTLIQKDYPKWKQANP